MKRSSFPSAKTQITNKSPPLPCATARQARSATIKHIPRSPSSTQGEHGSTPRRAVQHREVDVYSEGRCVGDTRSVAAQMSHGNGTSYGFYGSDRPRGFASLQIAGFLGLQATPYTRITEYHYLTGHQRTASPQKVLRSARTSPPGCDLAFTEPENELVQAFGNRPEVGSTKSRFSATNRRQVSRCDNTHIHLTSLERFPFFQTSL